MEAARAGRRLEIAAVLAAIVLLGVLAAPLPFTGDQALFAAGARQLAHGDVLYRDFWDVKQPGIYFFYVVSGSVVGYSEVGLHLAELAYQLAFAVVLIVTLRGRFTHRWVGPLVPLLILGTYYATIEPLQLGQVESLLGFPLYLTLWCAARAPHHGRARTGWLAASGVAGGLVLVLKLVLLPVVGGIWLVAVWHLARTVDTDRARVALGTAAAIAAGAAVPLLVVGAYVAATGQLATVRWTYFTVSPKTTGIAGRPLSRLTDGLVKTAARWALPLAFGAVGLVVAARHWRHRFELGLLAWLVLGVPVFLIQHWWIYTYAMFLVPVGILAGYGLDTVAGAWPRLQTGARVAIVALAVLLLVPAAVRLSHVGRDVARHDFALSAGDRAALRTELEPAYHRATVWAARVNRPDAPRGGVYVLGNPIDLYVADREQTVAINGWSPEQYPADVWARLGHQIETARPVELVVDGFSHDIMRDRAPETLALIRRLYRAYGGSGTDVWYRRR